VPPCIWTFLSRLGKSQSFRSLLDHGRCSPVDIDGDTRQIAGAIGSQERDNVSCFVGFAYPPERHASGFRLLRVALLESQARICRPSGRVAPLVLAALDEPDANRVTRMLSFARSFDSALVSAIPAALAMDVGIVRGPGVRPTMAVTLMILPRRPSASPV